MRRWLGAALLSALLGGASAGLPAARAEHCRPVFMFSGVKAGPVRSPALNPGATCVMRDENIDTNVFVPGANFVVVATTMTPVNATGSLVLDDRPPVTLTFTYSPSARRWSSQDVMLDGARRATATVQSVTGVTVSVTYRAVAP